METVHTKGTGKIYSLTTRAFEPQGKELSIDWLMYPPSPLVLLRVKSQYILGDIFPVSLASSGIFTIHLLESFTYVPPLIPIKS